MIRILLFVISYNVFTYCGAQTSIRKMKDSIHQVLQHNVDRAVISGAVVSVAYHGKEVYRESFGYACMKERDGRVMKNPEKMTADHLFDIASLTKVVGTTTGIMKLVDQGKIKVDDPVSLYIKAFATSEKKGMTIRHLLTHTSGLYEWYPMYYRARGRKEVYQLIASLPLQNIPGRVRKYSDLGFTILGQLIEVVSGKTLEAFLQKEVFTPLGMTHTFYLPLEKPVSYPIAATSTGNPYEYRMVHDSSLGFVFKEIDPFSWNRWRGYVLKGEVNDGNAWYAGEGVSGAAGLFSTVRDIQKLVNMLLRKGDTGKNIFLTHSTITQFLSADQFANGLGWMMDSGNAVMKNAPPGSFGHTGFTGTSIVAVPEKELSVILLINRQHTGLLETKEYYNVNPIRKEIFSLVMKSFL